MLTDFIDYETGERKHIEDHKDQVIAVSTKQLRALEALWNATQNEVANRNAYYTGLGRLENSWQNLHLNVAQFDRLANAVYAESSGGVRESYGIVNVLENRAAADGTDLMTQVSDAPGYGVYGVRSNAYSTEQGPAADQKERNINKAIALAIPGKDITNGAFFWDGKDFSGTANIRGGYNARYKPGYLFTSPSHDLWKQGSNPVRGTYRYESTAAIGSTTFSRKFNMKGKNWR